MNHKSVRTWVALAASVGLLALLVATSPAQGQSRGVKNPFSPPDASIHYAPDRQYDLQNIDVDLTIDYPNRAFSGQTVNTLRALRDGTTSLKFHAGDMKIDGVELDGAPAQYKRVDDGVEVATAPTKVGQKLEVTIRYHVKRSETKSPLQSGFHWLDEQKSEPSKMGFFTFGEPENNRDWAPTWDYPNDFATSKTTCTVPSDWDVVGNGVKQSDKLSEDRKTRTVVWKLDIPHATYLFSLAAGPFDIKKDKWRGVDLMYVVPRGKGGLIDYTFENTKDMLSFFSDTFGYKYPWPKYAQDCVFEFPGGQENVSATTLGQDFLTDKRAGYHNMDSLNSHELAHQWFGDTVTCKDWGQVWLNESFATFMEMAYIEHSRGLYAYQRELEANSQGYFEESHRYQRPLATNFYQNPNVMFDQHTYPKGSVLIHNLRRILGDKPFYAGIKRYLNVHQHTPVETSQLRDEMTDATGINCEPWFNQWILKPGHPVIDYSWNWDEAKKEVVVHVKQTQDVANGVPVYDVAARLGLLRGGIERRGIHLNAADQEFRLSAEAKPDAVVFDPDHDFLREIPKQPWAHSELTSIVRFAPNCIDRATAMDTLLKGNPTDSDVQVVVEALKADTGPFPAFDDDHSLVKLKREDLRGFFEGELKHEAFERRTAAVEALAALSKNPTELQRLKGLVNDVEPYSVVAAVINGLADQDFASSADVIERQARTATNSTIRAAAISAMAKAGAPGALDLVFAAVSDTNPDDVRTAGFRAMASLKGDDPRTVPALRAGLTSHNFRLLQVVLQTCIQRKVKEVIPDLEQLKKAIPFAAGFFEDAITQINKP